MANNKLQIKGKIAQFPDNVKIKTALSFLEKIKVNSKHIWYVIIEEQENNLKMVKYNNSLSLNLVEYINELKFFYEKELNIDLSKMEVVGEADYSVIMNIPDIIVEDKKLISKITKDLIELLTA